ncbi:MAG: (d)CMP kinase [Christensenellaceae bacterium]|jgi:cytidylate kinase|nr:(d)CMP kinase [Christensenellaceae bacterium]
MKTNEPIHIAIDGPTASGKGSISKLLSARLGIPTLDTGAMYRGIAVYFFDNPIDLADKTALNDALSKVDLKVALAPSGTRVFINGVDVTPRIRDNNISLLTSRIAVLPEVRQKLVAIQQAIAKTSPFILEGRDIGSEVLPNAQFKFFLTASPEVRASRRWKELLAKGSNLDFSEVLEQVNMRDKTDINRPFGALKKVPDAIEIDSSSLTPDGVIAEMLAHINGNNPR